MLLLQPMETGRSTALLPKEFKALANLGVAMLKFPLDSFLLIVHVNHLFHPLP